MPSTVIVGYIHTISISAKIYNNGSMVVYSNGRHIADPWGKPLRFVSLQEAKDTIKELYPRWYKEVNWLQNDR